MKSPVACIFPSPHFQQRAEFGGILITSLTEAEDTAHPSASPLKGTLAACQLTGPGSLLESSDLSAGHWLLTLQFIHSTNIY